jgi:predicted AlkP superfamily phosphohydrolase/phosphomutase
MKTLILGFDAFDPAVFERLSEQGRLPNLTRYAESGGYARFSVTDPPQTEVSWTSIATGLNPGGHGVFDFVHRDPATYTPYVSLLPTARTPFGTQFVSPHRARTIFEQAARQGFAATALWWPATFPARPELPVQTIPGLGTPDVRGRLGVGTLFSAGAAPDGEDRKTPVVRLERRGKDRYSGLLEGPGRKMRSRERRSALELHLDVLDDHSARLVVGKQSLELRRGEWSPILDLSFNLGRLLNVRSLTRAILTGIRPDVRLYLLPLQIHPLHSPWRYGTPRAFVRRVWKACGPFLTLGLPQDTTALEDGCITDGQFLDLCASIYAAREAVLLNRLERFHDGILASVFDSVDRVQHMFWRNRPDLVDEWYARLDGLVGRVERYLAEPGRERVRVIVVSDHGFADYRYKVHLNRWLIEQGYLVAANGGETSGLLDVDWSSSRAYAIGLNSLYVNLAGREGQGCVPAGDYERLIDALCSELQEWLGPDGRRVVLRAQRQDEAFVGPLSEYGPDVVVGFSPGYRASPETGLGRWKRDAIEPNHDHWNADHCIDSRAVPGVLFCNQGLAGFAHPSYRDLPPLAIGTAVDGSSPPVPPVLDEEDLETIEERLRSLGYL